MNERRENGREKLMECLQDRKGSKSKHKVMISMERIRGNWGKKGRKRDEWIEGMSRGGRDREWTK